jgi:hypothetical protein
MQASPPFVNGKYLMQRVCPESRGISTDAPLFPDYTYSDDDNFHAEEIRFNFHPAVPYMQHEACLMFEARLS